MHQRITRNTTPGKLPAIINPLATPEPRQSVQVRNINIISQEVLNHLTKSVYARARNSHWTPIDFLEANPTQTNDNLNLNIEHMASAVVHPTTGETITSYKKLADDLVTSLT